MNIYKQMAGMGILLLTLLSSCDTFLEAKPNSSTATVETIKDMNLLLENWLAMNQCAPSLIEVGSDDYFVSYDQLMALPVFEQDAYFWRDPFSRVSDITLQWIKPYAPVMVANVILETLERSDDGSPQARNTIRGEALFLRGFSYYLLAQVYAMPYSVENHDNYQGIVIRTSSDINSPSTRATIGASYDHIIADLKAAVDLLPLVASANTRASKPAALAVLARVYLVMGNYKEALHYAESLLQIQAELLDFNTLEEEAKVPIPLFNKESLFFSMSNSTNLITPDQANIAPDLLALYAEGDLRKRIYFYAKSNGLYGFKGAFTANPFLPLFVGPTVAEMYLIKAECLVRMGEVSKGVVALNQLLVNRWDRSLFRPFATDNKEVALVEVLKERRKELVFRGLRWSDLRRLNQDPQFKITLRRETLVNGQIQVVELPPDSKHYTFLIPEQVIRSNGVRQSER